MISDTDFTDRAPCPKAPNVLTLGHFLAKTENGPIVLKRVLDVLESKGYITDLDSVKRMLIEFFNFINGSDNGFVLWKKIASLVKPEPNNPETFDIGDIRIFILTLLEMRIRFVSGSPEEQIDAFTAFFHAIQAFEKTVEITKAYNAFVRDNGIDEKVLLVDESNIRLFAFLYRNLSFNPRETVYTYYSYTECELDTYIREKLDIPIYQNLPF